MSEQKFVGYFRLVEACGESGCPVCHCLLAEGRNYLDALLYEQVTDPDTRRAIRAAWGFCNWHTWMLLEIEHSLFGASIIYEDLVALTLQRIEQLQHKRVGAPRRGGWLGVLWRRPRQRAVPAEYRQRAVCPACAHAADAERRYLRTLLRVAEDGDLQAAYARSDGLCLPHLFAAVEENSGDSGANALVERTREKWARVGRDIASFVSKHDYRNREPYTPAEAASYRRAFELLVGAKSVFGNDVHARTTAGVTERPEAVASSAGGNGLVPGVVGRVS
ncbi:MAG: hypothetical protein C5B48_12420 [Candidatus Rokuibacteriota bacterium]|nr:MAG: hypothetical protein C5B48_12420 [Candidatus Rokubacteria bacterium]